MIKQYKCSQCGEVRYFAYMLRKAFMFVCCSCGRIYYVTKKEGDA